MSETRTISDAADRRTQLLAAAARLLDRGGYAALTARAVAAEAGVSIGLLYHYFADKHDVFGALLEAEQARLIELIDATPRESVAQVLRAVVPAATDQWRRVGRMSAAWAADRPAAPAETRRSRRRSTDAQFSALRRALIEAADAEGRVVSDDPAMVTWVWSSLMGMADHIVNGWTRDLPVDDLVNYSVDAILRAISDDPRSAEGRPSR